MNSPLDEIEYLTRSEHRIEVIDALADGPHSRSDLRAMTGASSSTIGRMLREFETQGWVVRDGHQHRATSAGQFIVEEVTKLLTRVEAERTLRDAAQWLPTEKLDITIETFAEAIVTVADDEDPYRPVERYGEIIEAAETMWAFGTTTLKSANAGSLFQSVRDGMETEIIYPPPIVEIILEWSPEVAKKGLARGNLTTLLHDTLPCGLTIFDDRVALTSYNPGTGMLRAIVDTDARKHGTGESHFTSHIVTKRGPSKWISSRHNPSIVAVNPPTRSGSHHRPSPGFWTTLADLAHALLTSGRIATGWSCSW